MPYRKTDKQYEKVNYCEFGDQRNPTIVCIHGLAGNGSYSFGELVTYLKENFHMIILDMPGHGETKALPKEEDYLFTNLANWLQEVFNIILQKPFFIMGHSWGADVALHFTRHFPKNVEGLLLLDGAFTFPQNQPEMTLDYAYTGWSNYMDNAVFQSEQAIFQEYRGYTKNWNARKEKLTCSLFQIRQDNKFEMIVSKFTVLSIIKAFFEEPFSKAYSSIRIPTILIHAELPQELTEARKKECYSFKSQSAM